MSNETESFNLLSWLWSLLAVPLGWLWYQIQAVRKNNEETDARITKVHLELLRSYHTKDEVRYLVHESIEPIRKSLDEISKDVKQLVRDQGRDK